MMFYSVVGILLHAIHLYPYKCIFTTLKFIIAPILQMRKLRLHKCKLPWLDPNRRQIKNVNLGQYIYLHYYLYLTLLASLFMNILVVIYIAYFQNHSLK